MIAIFFVFTVPPDPGEPGVVAWPVWARQLPRLIVAAMNGEGDRGLRYFPFLGVQDGRRTFLEPREPLPPAVLSQIHGQQQRPHALIDGQLRGRVVSLRVLRGDGMDELLTCELPFDPEDPWRTVRRAVFELQGVLGIQCPLPEAQTMSPELLRAYLVSRDTLLGLEASLIVEGAERALGLALQVWEERSEDPEVEDLVVELSRHLVRHGIAVDEVTERLVELAEDQRSTMRLLRAIAPLLEVAGSDAAKLAVTRARQRIAWADPGDADAVLAASVSMFHGGDVEGARVLLRSAVDSGNEDHRIRAQLAACEEVVGETHERDRLLDQLASDDSGPIEPGPARLVASWLVDRGESTRAVAVLDRALAEHGQHAGLWLERGRASLGVQDLERARSDLQRCLDLRPDDAMRFEANRLMQLAQRDSALPGVIEVEDQLAEGDFLLAQCAATKLVKEHKDLAEAHLLLGICEQRLRHFGRAIRCFQRALKRRPDCAEAHNRLGILLAERRRPKQGYSHLRHAVELAPDDGGAWVHLAQVAAQLGNLDEAREALQEAERLRGQDEVFLAVRARLDL